MNEAGLPALLLFVVLATLATFFGIRLAARAAWTGGARQTLLPYAVGVALAPFLLGLVGVLVLALLPGAAARMHLFAVGTILLVGAVAAGWSRSPNPVVMPITAPWLREEKILAAALLVTIGALLFNTCFLPLTQNDSLEYALVGRALFERPALTTYPVIDPAAVSSGFYGPWTHPPLYPVLIYLTNAMQGQADIPGLMRIIAPWALLACAFLVGALGQLRDRLTGLLAAHFVLCVPLLFLGADSALIDALPVLGFALVLAVLAGTEGSGVRNGIALGVAMGLTLWAHSQAILIIPLALGALLIRDEGLPRLAAIIRLASAAILIAFLLAGWPYVRNWLIFGSPISDTPGVFALPELAWADYFSIGRGIDSWPSRIQYGLFKGWFALEAYGVVFWSALPGLAVFLLARNRTAEAPALRRALRIATAFGVVYICGVAASLALGIDLMIRNERYWLVLVPSVALLSAHGAAWLVARRPFAIAAAAAAAGFAVISIGLVAFRVKSTDFDAGPAAIGESLRRLPPYAATEFLRRNTPGNAVVLSLKPSDMFYADRRMVSYLDPRLIPFYRESDPAKALDLLLDLGVTHVHLPDYLLPPAYHGPFARIISRPEWAKLLFSDGGYQVYHLAHHAAPPAMPTELDLTPGKIPWTRTAQWTLGGRKGLGKFALTEQGPLVGPALSGAESLLFQRDRLTTGITGSGTLDGAPDDAFISVTPNGEYLLQADIEGHAFVQVRLWQFDADRKPIRSSDGRVLRPTLLGEFSLGRSIGQVELLRRFRTDPTTVFVRIGFEIRGHAHLQLSSLRLKGPYSIHGTALN